MTEQASPWLVLVVDDDPGVRDLLRAWSAGLELDGRAVQVLEASDGEEALVVLRRSPSVAVVILDQIMATENEGIETAQKIRHQLGLREVRIVLSTAADTVLPRLEALRNEEINDIEYKRDLGAVRFQALLISQLRNYRDLILLKAQETLSARLLHLSGRIQAAQSFQELERASLHGINYLSASIAPALPRPNPACFFLQGTNDRIELTSGTGMFEGQTGDLFWYVLSPADQLRVRQALEGLQPLWQSDLILFPFRTSDGVHRLLGACASERWDLSTLNAIKIFCSRIPLAFDRLALIQSLRQRQEELERSVREREVLLRELHHRVKNNLQIISSLLRLDDDPQRLQDRIWSMALVHDQLYQLQRFSEVDLVDYLENLCQDVANAYHLGSHLRVESSSREITVSYQKALPLGLIVNELVINAAKYARDEKGPLPITVRILGESPLVVRVEDRGPGRPSDRPRGSGLKLVELLLEQLRGQLRESYHEGQWMEVVIP